MTTRTQLRNIWLLQCLDYVRGLTTTTGSSFFVSFVDLASSRRLRSEIKRLRDLKATAKYSESVYRENLI